MWYTFGFLAKASYVLLWSDLGLLLSLEIQNTSLSWLLIFFRAWGLNPQRVIYVCKFNSDLAANELKGIKLESYFSLFCCCLFRYWRRIKSFSKIWKVECDQHEELKSKVQEEWRKYFCSVWLLVSMLETSSSLPPW